MPCLQTSSGSWQGMWIQERESVLVKLFRSDSGIDNANAHIKRALSRTVDDAHNLGHLVHISGSGLVSTRQCRRSVGIYSGRSNKQSDPKTGLLVPSGEPPETTLHPAPANFHFPAQSKAS